MREETREHQIVDTFALLPPSDRLRLRGGTYSPGLPTVVVQSHSEKSRKNNRVCLRRYLKPILLITVAIFVVDVVNDFFFVGAGIPAPPMIQRDYSQVTSVEDISLEYVQSKCFVREK